MLVEPGACIQLLQLREQEGIECVVLLAGKNRGHNCQASEIIVTGCDLDAILRPLKIELPDEPDNYKQ